MNDLKDITTVINSLRAISGVGICYYDLEHFFNYSGDNVRQNIGHYCEFCKAARELKNGKARCEKSDRLEAVQLALEYKEPFFFECHLGMRELVLPLLSGENLIGILFVGQCRIAGEENETTVASKAAIEGGDPDVFLELYRKLPLLTREDLQNVCSILSLYLGTRIEHIKSMGISPEPTNVSPAERARLYIENHYKSNLSSVSLAKKCFVSPEHLARSFKKTYGTTLTEYINHVRISKAKQLLIDTEATVSSVALNVGFSDPNYFTRVFKRRVGQSPTEFQAKK